jgi:PAS domain S-box-containing protein
LFDPENAALAWQRLRFALGAAGLGTWHVDLRTGVATHDENFNRILGVAAEETTGSLDDPAFTHIHPDDLLRVSAAIATAVKTHVEYHLEFRIIRTDGVVRWLRDRGRVILDADGTALFATGAVMDVTEQRRIEDHDRILAAVTQALATSAGYEQMPSDVASLLAPAFADECSIALDGDDLSLPDDPEARDVFQKGVPSFAPRKIVVPLRAGGHALGTITFGSQHGHSTTKTSRSPSSSRTVLLCPLTGRGCCATCSRPIASRTSSSPRCRTSSARRSTPSSAGRGCCGEALSPRSGQARFSKPSSATRLPRRSWLRNCSICRR